MHKIHQELELIICDKLKKYNDEADKLEKEFQYLNNCNIFPQAYQETLMEISRRREFDLLM